MNKTSGFTLIELLTVIAIIGILAAIMIPVVGAVRAKAKSSQCVSNLRQIGLALQTYAGDNKGNFPPTYVKASPPAVAGVVQWRQALAPYVSLDKVIGSASQNPEEHKANSAGVFLCPAHDYDSAIRKMAYGYNRAISLAHWAFRANAPKDPSRIFIVGEMDYNGELVRPDGSSNAPVRRHPGDKGNFLFVDAHVQSIAGPVPAADPRWWTTP